MITEQDIRKLIEHYRFEALLLEKGLGQASIDEARKAAKLPAFGPNDTDMLVREIVKLWEERETLKSKVVELKRAVSAAEDRAHAAQEAL